MKIKTIRRGDDMKKVIKQKMEILSAMKVKKLSKKIDLWKILAKFRRGRGKRVSSRFDKMLKVKEECIRKNINYSIENYINGIYEEKSQQYNREVVVALSRQCFGDLL